MTMLNTNFIAPHQPENFSIMLKKRYSYWLYYSSILFGLTGVASLILTDLIIVPHAPGIERSFIDMLWLSKEPIFLLSSFFPPIFFAYIAAHRWLIKNSKFFSGWLSVAIASWLSLVLNPIIWLLVAASFVVYGFIVLALFLSCGIFLSVLWRIQSH